MQKILQMRHMADVAEDMDPKVFAYIKEGQIESFECFAHFDLLAFDYYDILGVGINNPKIMIYLDKEDLFFFCENEHAEKHVRALVKGAAADGEAENQQLLYRFFVRLLKGDMDYLEGLEQRINDAENMLFSRSERGALAWISTERKELLRLKRYYSQLDSIFDEMSANDNELLSETVRMRIQILGARTDRYLRAVCDLQEMISQLREAYQSQLSIRQNDLMKVFTVVTAIFLPLTLIVGWYGMNFVNMPELHWRYGYPCVFFVCIAIVLVLLWFFKRKKWL